MKYSGVIKFSNGLPAQDVSIRVFDADNNSRDDDLTVNGGAGLSNSSGEFDVNYNPLAYMDTFLRRVFVPVHVGSAPWDWRMEWRNVSIPDVTDMFLPYLELRYTFDGQPRIRRMSLNLLSNTYILPEILAQEFLPSIYGLNFENSFHGIPLPVTVFGHDLDDNTYGLCGGMASAAYDFYLNGTSAPARNLEPSKGSELYEYIYNRQLDSLGFSYFDALKFQAWSIAPTEGPVGTQKMSYDEFKSIRADLDDKKCVVLGVVFVDASEPVWKNHQVLAYKYEQIAGGFNLYIYDPNNPNNDNVIIRLRPTIEFSVPQILFPWFPGINIMGYNMEHLSGNTTKNVRGIFKMTYAPKDPSDLFN